MRPRQLALVAAAVIAAVGIVVVVFVLPREDAPAPLRVRIVFAAADGEGRNQGFFLRESGGRRIPLRPSRDDARLLEADGADGGYVVDAPEGWGIVGGERPMGFRRGEPGVELSVGKRHTVYLVPGDPSLAVGDVAVFSEADRMGRKAELLVVRRDEGSDGRVAVRVRPQDWGSAVRVAARLGPGTLSDTLRVALPADGGPTGVSLKPGAVAPLDVVLVPSPAGAAPPEGEVVAEVSQGPLSVRVTARIRASEGVGIARFDAVPAAVRTVRLALATASGERELWRDWPATEWRRTGEIRFLVGAKGAKGAEGAKSGTLSVTVRSPAPGILAVLARPEGGSSYGIAGLAVVGPKGNGAQGTEGDAMTLPVALPAGRYRLIVVSGDRGERIAEAVDVTEGGDVPVEVKPGRLGSVRGTISRPAPGALILVRFRRVEKDAQGETKAHVATAWPDAGLSYEVRLPAGEYEITTSYGSRESVPVPTTLEPGTDASTPTLALPR